MLKETQKTIYADYQAAQNEAGALVIRRQIGTLAPKTVVGSSSDMWRHSEAS
jgi:hypothetical protein